MMILIVYRVLMILLVVSNVAGHAADHLHWWYPLHIFTLLSTVFATSILISLIVISVVVGAATKNYYRVIPLA